MDNSIFNTLMNTQLVSEQQRAQSKKSEKKQHERTVSDEVQLEISQEASKVQTKRKKQRSVLTKRRLIADALVKKKSRSVKSQNTQEVQKGSLKKLKNEKALKNESENELKEALKQHPALSRVVSQLTSKLVNQKLFDFEPKSTDPEFLPDPEDLPELFKPESDEAKKAYFQRHLPKTGQKKANKHSKAAQAHIQKMTPKEKKAYLTKLMSGNTNEMLEALVNQSYLVGSTLSDAEILALRAKVSKNAKKIQRIIHKGIPHAAKALRRAGLGSQIGSVGGIAPKPEKHEDQDSNQAIFAAMAAALDLDSLLQELGIHTDITVTNVQNVTATEEAKEAKAQAEHNIHEIKRNERRAKCAKVIKIFSYIAAFILIMVGQPEAGTMMFLSASGALDYIIKELAKHIPGMTEVGLKSLIVALTIIVAVCMANPTIMGDDAISAMSAFGGTMLVAGSIGFFQDALGYCATDGGRDPSKYPAWTTWTALAISMIPTAMDMGSFAYTMIAKSLANSAARVAEGAETAMISAEAAAQAAKAAVSGAEEAEVAGVTASRAAAEAGEQLEEEAARSAGRLAARFGQSAAAGVDTVTTASSEAATSAVRSLENASTEVAPVAGEATEVGSALSAPEEAPTGVASESETSASGQARAAESVAGAARTTAEDLVASAESGADAVNTAVSGVGPTAVNGSESYAATAKAAAETAEEETAKDPFKTKLEKVLKALDEAKKLLSRYESAEESAAAQSEELASKVAGQLKKAQEEVERLEKEVIKLTEQVTKQEKAVATVTQRINEFKEAQLKLVQEIATEESKASPDLAKISALRTSLAAINGDLEAATAQLNTLNETQQALFKAQEALEKAVAKKMGWESQLKTEHANSARSKYAEIKAKLNQNFGKVGRLLLLVDTGGEVYAQSKMAEINLELADIMAELAVITGNYELLSSFCSILGVAEDSIRTKNQQYGQDLADDYAVVADILKSELRAASALMSA